MEMQKMGSQLPGVGRLGVIGFYWPALPLWVIGRPKLQGRYCSLGRFACEIWPSGLQPNGWLFAFCGCLCVCEMRGGKWFLISNLSNLCCNMACLIYFTALKA